MPPTVVVTAVSEIMDRDPLTVGPQTTVAELVKRFQTECVDAIPVVDANGVLKGIVTSLDLLRLMRPGASLGIPGVRSLPARRVESVMRPGVITLEPTDPILAALDLMIDTRFHMLPVVKRGAQRRILIGVVPQRLLLSKLLALSRRPPQPEVSQAARRTAAGLRARRARRHDMEQPESKESSA